MQEVLNEETYNVCGHLCKPYTSEQRIKSFFQVPTTNFAYLRPLLSKQREWRHLWLCLQKGILSLVWKTYSATSYMQLQIMTGQVSRV